MTKVLDLKVFVPAKDFAQSCEFYQDLGFSLNWESPDLAEFQIGDYRFFLQNFYRKELAENFMLQLMVDDLDIWVDSIKKKGLDAKYSLRPISEPKLEPWGLKVSYLLDPSGVLWQFAGNKK